MLKALLKINLIAVLNWFTGGKKRAKTTKESSAGRMALYAIAVLYIIGIAGWMFLQIFGLLAEPLAASGLGWLYFVYAFILTFAVMFVFNVFSAKNRLYEAKDNDLLLSMPIPPAYILLSRMLMLVGINLLCGIVVTGPAVYVWLRAAGFDAMTLLFSVLLFLATALFALAVSSFFGWLLSLASSRLNKKALVETVLSLAFLAAYFILYMRINEIISGLLSSTDSIAQSVGSILPLYWIGSGMAGSGSGFALGMLILLVPFALVYAVLSRTFIRTATKKRGTVKKEYTAKEQKVSSARNALLRREFSRFFSSSTLIVNDGLSAIFLLVGAVVLAVNKTNVTQALGMMPGLEDILFGAAVVIAALMAGLVQPTSCLVSLEGRSIWIVQSMPVDPGAVLTAKLRLSLILYLPPTLIFVGAAAYVLDPAGELIPLALLLSAGLVVLMAELGLIANVNHPMLSWASETQAIKSGAATLLCMVFDLGVCAVLGLGGYLIISLGGSVELAMLIMLLLTFVAARLLYSKIRTRCAEKFAVMS